MAKVIRLIPPRAKPKARIVTRAGQCPACPHQLSVHITHPNGVVSCAARGCRCETRPAG